MSITSGIRSGVISGMRSGINAGFASQDATSGKFVPASATEWDSVLSSASLSTKRPMSAWLLQEASGNPADSIGSVPLTAAGTPGYQQTVAGWSRKAVTWTDASSSKFTNFANVPALNAASFALLGYFFTTNTPAAVREIAGVGAATVSQVNVNTTQKYGVTNVSAVRTDGTVNAGANVRPLLLAYNVTASSFKLYTDAEIITAGYVNVSGGGVWLGGQIAATPTGGCLYASAWTGTNAEFTDAQVRTLLQTLGWTVAW